MKKDDKAKVVSAATDDAVFEAALACVRDGDRGGYSDLFTAFSRPLAALAQSLGVSDPHDVVNRAFINAFAAIDRFTGCRLDFICFVYTVTSFEIEDRVRQRPASLETDPRAAALMGLTRAQREALCLQVFFGLRAPDVADATGQTVRTVRWLRDRANANLRSADPAVIGAQSLGEPAAEVSGASAESGPPTFTNQEASIG